MPIVPDRSLSMTTRLRQYAYRFTPPSTPIGSRVENLPVAGSLQLSLQPPNPLGTFLSKPADCIHVTKTF